MSDDWITVDELRKIKGYGRTSYYNRRNEILNTRYAKAVLKDGRKTLINITIWDQWLKWRSDQWRAKRQGLESVRDKTVLR